MNPDRWYKLALVFAAGGLGVLAALLAGLAVVPICRRRSFISRESKIGVAQGRRDAVPMGGGFILLIGVSVVVTVFMALRQIRVGYAACFLIAFWGFAALGFLDDCSKTRQRGYSDSIKVLLQVTVTMIFAVSFYYYGTHYVEESDLGLLALPFVHEIGLGPLYVAFVMLFLFYVSNAVNITDGFNGLAGGVGAIVALAFSVATFLLAVYQAEYHHPLTAARMYALAIMSAGVAGGCVGYLYFNFTRGAIYFGDTGSMALGAALGFLALFSRAEFLMVVIGGVFFAEAGSVALQRLWELAGKGLYDPALFAWVEPTKPLIIAPLHHHFEHLMCREQEVDGRLPAGVREAVRRRLTLAAWRWAAAFAVVGVVGQWGRYGRQDWAVFDWACVLGVVMILALLGFGVVTRLLYDCYFIGPDHGRGGLLTLYRGLPLRLGRRHLYRPYEVTDIPVERLGYLERRTGLFRLFANRVDARVAFGLLHFGFAEESDAEQRKAHRARALAFWELVPPSFLRPVGRQEVLRHMAVCYRDEGRPARAVDCLEVLYQATGDPRLVDQIEQLTAGALATAEQTWAHWQAARLEAMRAAAANSHAELLALMRGRRERAARELEILREAEHDLDTAAGEAAVAGQVADLQAAMALAEDRLRQLRAAGPSPAPAGD
jgi:phospho-N-acetylmuramoyl-pentapeptide-transferase